MWNRAGFIMDAREGKERTREMGRDNEGDIGEKEKEGGGERERRGRGGYAGAATSETPRADIEAQKLARSIVGREMVEPERRDRRWRWHSDHAM